jgi:3',5'-cyclic AMP phosphodiesterase CpdA
MPPVAPVVAIPGNHDGDVAPGARAASLEAFVAHFCAARPARGAWWGRRRRAINQPNVYWTLEHDWVTIIGLYTNVAEGGTIDADQLRWLTAELGAARRGAALILAMHHPIYLLESAHGSSLELGVALDRCFAEAGRAPDVVIAAHAHNYQRFARRYENRLIPYVVAGTGGFPERPAAPTVSTPS